MTFRLLVFNELEISIAALLDPISASFLFAVSIIACSVMVFSNSYMASEKFNYRFHLLVVAFVISIVVLITRPNLLIVLLGWDGLGVTSYLLVIYFNRAKARNAGILTALTNRIGDVAILVRLAAAFSWGRITHMCSMTALGLDRIMASIIILAAITKSAQIPFSA